MIYQGLSAGPGQDRVRIVTTMKKNWVRWVFGLLFVSWLGIFAFQILPIWKAIHSGASPLEAFQASQQESSHIFLNPWVFTVYLLIFVVLLWNTVRTVARKQRH